MHRVPEMHSINAELEVRTQEDAHLFQHLFNGLVRMEKIDDRMFRFPGISLPMIYVELTLNPQNTQSLLGHQKIGIYAAFMQVKKDAARISRGRTCLSVERWRTHSNYTARVVACVASLMRVVPDCKPIVDQTRQMWHAIAQEGSLIVHPNGTSHQATSNYVRRGAAFFLRLVEQMCATIDRVFDERDPRRAHAKALTIGIWIASRYLSLFNWGNNKYREILPSKNWQNKGDSFRRFHDAVCDILAEVNLDLLEREMNQIGAQNRDFLWRYFNDSEGWSYWKEEAQTKQARDRGERRENEEEERKTSIQRPSSAPLVLSAHSSFLPPLHVDVNSPQVVNSGFRCVSASPVVTSFSQPRSRRGSFDSIGSMAPSPSPSASSLSEGWRWDGLEHDVRNCANYENTDFNFDFDPTQVLTRTTEEMEDAANAAPETVPLHLDIQMDDADISESEDEECPDSAPQSAMFTCGPSTFCGPCVCEMSGCGQKIEDSRLDHVLDCHLQEMVGRISAFDLDWMKRHVHSAFQEAVYNQESISRVKLESARRELNLYFCPYEFQEVKTAILECIDQLERWAPLNW